MSWEYDAEAGVYKDHALSSRIRMSAVANAKCARFLRPETGFGRHKGDTVNITRVHDLPLATRVAETENLPTGRPIVDTVSKTVAEWGYAVPLTAKEEDLTHFDLRNKIQTKLKSQMTLTMDVMAAETYKGTVIKCVSTSASAMSFTTNGTPSGGATHNMSILHLREIHDYLAGQLKAEPLANGKYVGILPTWTARGIKNDSEYKDWQAPTGSGPLLDGRLRDVENFMLFETNHYAALDNTIGTTPKTGEAIFFGDDAAFLATVYDPELRKGLKTNLGRYQEVGWVGMLDAGLTWPAAADEKIVHWTST